MTDVEVYQPQGLAPVGPVELETMIRQADLLSQSTIIPRDYRGKPANVLVAAMTGRTFGWDVMTAMRNGHVIEGTWTIKPEAMLALIRRAGHSVTGETSPEGATVVGKRGDTGDEMSVTFTMADAVRAGLAAKTNWKQYPQAMCWARAVSQLARMLFADVTLGLSYTPEELGAEVDADGAVVSGSLPAPVDEGPRTISPANVEAVRKRCDELGVDIPDVVRLATEGRTDDPTEVLVSEIQALRDACTAVAELGEPPADPDLVEPSVEPQGNAGFDYEQDAGVDPAEARRQWDEQHPDTEF
jgi:hypothetical protein